MPISKFKIAGVCGVVAPVVVLLSVVIAIFLAPGFSWSNNALSDLGASGTAATVFNSGLVVGGILMMIFAAGLFGSFRGKILGQVGGVVFSVTSVALAGIGIFPTTTGLHIYVSGAFFGLFFVSLLVIGASMVLGKQNRKFGYISILVAILAALPWVGWAFWMGGLAIPEAISVTLALVWVIVMGLKLYRGDLMRQ